MKFRGLTSNSPKPQKRQGPGPIGNPALRPVVRVPDPTLKGVKGGNCNVTACQSPGAYFWNRVTDRHYCHHCARDMHKFALRVGEETLFPNYDAELLEMALIQKAHWDKLQESRAEHDGRSKV